MQTITPAIWCNGNADEAATYYEQVFSGIYGGATSRVMSNYPTDGLPDFQQSMAGKPLDVEVVIDGFRLDLINAGDEFRPNPALNFMLNFDPSREGDARENLDAVWSRLVDGGRVLMDVGEYPFSPRYGWVEDRNGVNWQLMLTNPEGEPRPFVITSFLFGAGAQNRAAEAQEKWVSIFPNSQLGMRAEYPEATGPVQKGSLMFSEFQLAGQWFTAMDSGVEQAESFSPGVSLMVEVSGQEEIDRLWDALSAVPEAEQCGWLADEFGVSWQIIPDNLEELMQRPGAYQNMLGMKKLQISDF